MPRLFQRPLDAPHDAWVIGNEPVVVVDLYGAGNYAKAL
jgi:hypothetical protein